MQTLALKVKRSWLETPTICAIEIEVAREKLPFKPRQCCLVELKLANGEVTDRDFSIALSPTRANLVFATRNTGSEFKKAFAELKAGDDVAISGPFGNFIFEDSITNAVFLSGGIGITPLKSMVEYASDKKSSAKLTLIYGNRTPEEIAFRKELDAMAKTNPNLKVVHVVSNPEQGKEKWNGLTGRITAEIIKASVENLPSAVFYICGPPGMVEALHKILQEMGVSEEKIKIENFTGYK